MVPLYHDSARYRKSIKIQVTCTFINKDTAFDKYNYQK